MAAKKVQEKYARIKALNCFDRVNQMLCYGYPAPEVARFIISQGEYKNVKFNTVVEAIQHYRRDEILPADVLACRRPDILVDANKKYQDKLEDLGRMDVLYEKLVYRLDTLIAKEMETGVSSVETIKTVNSIHNLMRTMHVTKMDLGISGQRQLGTVYVSPEKLSEIEDKYGKGAARAMANPVSRARVLSVLKAVEDEAAMLEREHMGEGIVVKRSDGQEDSDDRDTEERTS